MKRLFTGVAGMLLVAFAIAFMASAAQAETVTQAVGEAGTVTFTIDDNSVAFVGADPADGWTYNVDRADGDHLTVTFRDATGTEIEFEVEAGESGTQIANDTTGITTDDDEDDDDATSTSFGDTTVDDEDDDDDNSGPGSGDGDDSDDNSGPGSGDDDDSDDNSGPGSGDDEEDDDDADEDEGEDEDEDEDEDTSTSTTSTTIAG